MTRTAFSGHFYNSGKMTYGAQAYVEHQAGVPECSLVISHNGQSLMMQLRRCDAEQLLVMLQELVDDWRAA